jgi:hypothetical protein
MVELRRLRWWVICFSVIAGTAPTISFQLLVRPAKEHHGKSSLHYRNDGDGGQAKATARANRMSLPVLGPLLSQRAPVLPGQEFILNDPTPMQWQTLDQCLLQHATHVQNATKAAGVTAAPLVALLDEYTSSSSSVGITPLDARGRYATIVAIVGLSSTADEGNGSLLGKSGNGEFMERLQNRQRKSMRVRMMGIGRAVLTDFFFQSAKQDCMDDEGHLLDVPECSLHKRSASEEDDDDDDESHHDKDTTNNIIMAHFRLVHDDGVRRSSAGTADSKNAKSAHASPVHAVAQYSQLTFHIHRLHTDRQQLVAGLHAARARLAAATKREQQLQSSDYENDWEDHDGFGLLFASKEIKSMELVRGELMDQQPVIDKLLRDFPASASPALDEGDNSESRRSLSLLSNYGLGASAAAVSNMASIAAQRLELLKPYYSPFRHRSEEHFYEIYSFAAVQALQDSYWTAELAARAAAHAVQCRNTADRLQDVHDRMTEHVRLLRLEVSELSQQLRDCGEECTDLW